MKRNNIFMLAYIAFMLLSVVIRIFLNYDLWEPLVLAISISSVFFAADGFCNSVAHSIKGSCDIAREFISESKKNCQKDALFLAKVEKISETYQGDNDDLPEFVRSYSPLKDQHAQMIQGIEQFEADVMSKRRTQKRFAKWASIFAFAGFLVLFLALIIGQYIPLPAIVPEMISVASFAIVLFSQLIDGIADERIKNDLKNKREAIRRQEEIRNAFENTEQELDKYMELLNSNNTETEVEEDAD